MVKAVIFDADGVLIVNAMRFSEHLQEDYGISTKTTIPFFDEENVASAKEFGISAELYTSFEDFKSKMKTYLQE